MHIHTHAQRERGSFFANATLTNYHRNHNGESDGMILYIMKKMFRHLAELVFINAVIILLIHVRKPSHVVEHDIELINQPMQDVFVSATTIGILFMALSVVLVALVQWNQNMMVVVAAFFISLGTGRQIVAIALDTVTSSMSDFMSSWASILHLLAKIGKTPEWRSIENQVETIFTYKELEHKLPAKLDEVEPNSAQVYKYLNEHKWELGYQPTVTDEGHSCLAFAQYTMKQIMNKLEMYNQLLDVQQKSGGANTVVLIAIGTLIWLLS